MPWGITKDLIGATIGRHGRARLCLYPLLAAWQVGSDTPHDSHTTVGGLGVSRGLPVVRLD